MQQHWTKVARLPRGPLVCSCTWASKLSAISTTLLNSPTFQGGPLVFSFALAYKLLSAILTNLPFLPDSPNSSKSPALQGGPLVFSFALASKLLSAILTNLPVLPDSPNLPKPPALQGGPRLAKFCHFCHFCCCVYFWTYLYYCNRNIFFTHKRLKNPTVLVLAAVRSALLQAHDGLIFHCRNSGKSNRVCASKKKWP